MSVQTTEERRKNLIATLDHLSNAVFTEAVQAAQPSDSKHDAERLMRGIDAARHASHLAIFGLALKDVRHYMEVNVDHEGYSMPSLHLDRLAASYGIDLED